MSASIPSSSVVGVATVHELLATQGDSAQAVRRSRWRLVPAYALAGLAWGVAARGWMRLMANDPEFSWSGTIFIIVFATVVWTGGGIVAATRSGNPITRRVGRIAGTILSLMLGFGQGMLLLPTAIAGGVLLGRSPARRWGRRTLLAVAIAPMILLVGSLIHEGEHSAIRLVLIGGVTVVLCGALCVPFAALVRRPMR